MIPRCLAPLFLTAALGSGCAYITASDPVGETPVRFEDGELAGAWHGGEMTVTFEAVDPDTGHYRMQWTEDGKRKSLDLLLLQGGPEDRTWRFWNTRVADFRATEGDGAEGEPAEVGDENPDHYYWGRFRLDGDELMAWGPSAEKLAPLVADGTLPGELDDDNVRLGRLGPGHLAVIVSEDRGVLLDWENPLMLYRVIHD